MIYITQFIYLEPDQKSKFYEFEDIVLELLPKYNSRLLFRLAPSESSVIETQIPVPDEIHVLEFPSHLEFENFQKDPKRNSLMDLKKISVKSTFSILGSAL